MHAASVSAKFHSRFYAHEEPCRLTTQVIRSKDINFFSMLSHDCKQTKEQHRITWGNNKFYEVYGKL